MLLIDPGWLDARRAIASGPLVALRDSLRDELQPVIENPPEVPVAKALLSRAGGRCEYDGALLEFDPRSPLAHRCPRCGRVHEGELHHRAWVTSFQLWLAERCVHAAVFAVLERSEAHAAFARDVLRQYAARYAGYPNRDNVLGPTRLFFSTYLESIWLLQICVATSLLEHAGDQRTADDLRERVIAPSSALIADYDEGMSNRQVWNNAALLASAIMLGDSAAADRIVCGHSGIEAHLSEALLADGTWYEGENYHQFALRGLWYGVTLAEATGREIQADLAARFGTAFLAPFLTALPDFTFPSRKDSQYAVSLRQWRIAELTELGFARTHDRRLASALARCYEAGHERRDTGRSRSTADVERNGPSSALTRADLGWRALLFAVPALPAMEQGGERSTLLEPQGFAVFRREGGVYVGVDYGQSGGGHGHPDRLNLIVSVGDTRVLDDLGTGSYVDPSLHWYRSTLAHNAPLVGGVSQPLHDGVLRAYDEREGLGWIVASFETRPAVRLERAIVVAPDYLIDELRWVAEDIRRVELPWHLDAESALVFEPTALAGGTGEEDGFAFVREPGMTRLPPGQVFQAHGAVHVNSEADCDVEVYRAIAPGQPASVMRSFYLMRAQQRRGRMRTLLTWRAAPSVVVFAGETITVELENGERHVHRRDADGWHVGFSAGGARSSVDLGGFRAEEPAVAPEPIARPAPIVLRRQRDLPPWMAGAVRELDERAFVRQLAADHYRRSEDNWRNAGSPRAEVAVAASGDAIVIYAHVNAGDPRFARPVDENRYDNEHPDTMAAGAQLYVRTPDGGGGWAIVPDATGDNTHVRPIGGWGDLAAPRAWWRREGAGYEIRVELPLPSLRVDEYPVDLDLVINETTHDRERRRGQLVLSGARGEFVYLRGDRHDAARLIPFLVVE